MNRIEYGMCGTPAGYRINLYCSADLITSYYAERILLNIECSDIVKAVIDLNDGTEIITEKL